MAKIIIVPKPLDPFTITPTLQKYLDGWISYFKNLSWRIVVITPQNENFDLNRFELAAKENAGKGRHDDFKLIELIGWPEKRNVAFVVYVNSNFPGHGIQTFTKDIYLFSFGDIAFSLDHFESVEDSYYSYGLHNYEPDALNWKHMAFLIKTELRRIESSVPPVPLK